MTQQCMEMTTAILWDKRKFNCKHHDFRSKTTILLLEHTNPNGNTAPKTKRQKKTPKPSNAAQIYKAEVGENATKKWRNLSKEEQEPYIEKARALKQEWKRQNAHVYTAKVPLYANHEYIWIINVHLEAHGVDIDKKLNKSEMRLGQIKHAIERITNFTEQECQYKMKDIHCIICGDFNAMRGSEVDELLLNGAHKLKLKNAIDNILDDGKRSQMITHWRTGRCIDHIYYSQNNLKCVVLMETVPDFLKTDNGGIVDMEYPNKEIVSDHLPIAAMFEMVKSNESKQNDVNDGELDLNTNKRKRTFAEMTDESKYNKDRAAYAKRRKVPKSLQQLHGPFYL